MNDNKEKLNHEGEGGISLIIGGTSLFGRYLAPLLLKSGNKVIATKLFGQDVTVDPSLEKYTGDASRLEWAELDVLDKSSIIEVLAEYRPSVIYDFAVQNSVGYAWKNPAETVDINIIGALNLFDAVRSVPESDGIADPYNPTILMAGSAEEYGRNDYKDIPLAETVQPKPNNIFAATKVEQTLLANIYKRAYGLNVITLRTFNEIGPGMSGRFSISDFCKQFAEEPDQMVELHVGNVNTERDYTDVRDLVKAFISLSENGHAGEVYNAGAGHAVKVSTVVEILEKLTGKQAHFITDFSRMRLIDTPKLESDNRKIENDTGWKTTINLEDTIHDMYEYWKDKQ